MPEPRGPKRGEPWRNTAREVLWRRITREPPLLLDGATGTELERRGVYTGLPLWSAHALMEAPERVEEIHCDYVAAGAEVLTANTFRTQRRALAKGGAAGQAEALTARAVALARRAAASAEPARRVWVAGSVPPLEDCYLPNRVPADEDLLLEHGEHVRNLVNAGVDLLLVETMNTIREARIATGAARRAHDVVLVSFVATREGRLLSGEPLAQAVRAVTPLGPLAIAVNCLPPSAVPPCLEVLREGELPFGVYANLGAPNDETGFTRSEDCSPDGFVVLAQRWCEAGARVVGGCCGTTPAHIRALAERLHG